MKASSFTFPFSEAGPCIYLALEPKLCDRIEEGKILKGQLQGVIELEEKQFSELLSWGLIMGVDDGYGDDN